ncbi:MAG: YgjV family protein [Acidimicrobiia bacterium]|nr:YgjV family protein [Acidimicrobiia bacterium]
MIELVGYAASGLIVVSLMMTSVVRLRLINLVGSSTFIVYGVLIESIPIVLTNGVIVVINVVFLYRAATSVEAYSLARLDPHGDVCAQFLAVHADDIAASFPGFSYAPDPGDLVCLISRDLHPASLFIARPDGTGASVLLDYATPRYRDLGPGRHLFRDRRDVFSEAGIELLVSHTSLPAHRSYLDKVGFTETVSDTFELAL